ncbi:MAG: DUF2937 family protein [Burkholderiales bacterium]|jgi:hypothetical protein|nr:DUF2937 family protein [Burkholderiales bacterium]
MEILRGVLDRFILLASFFVAGCVPAFITQYRQRLGGALDQVTKDLAPFQEIAKQFHGGKMELLVDHHLYHSDPTFQAEGLAIQSMLRTLERLRAAVEAFNADLMHQIFALLTHSDAQIAKAAWGAYEPAFSFSAEGLLFAGGAALVMWLLFMLGWRMFFFAVDWLDRARA